MCPRERVMPTDKEAPLPPPQAESSAVISVSLWEGALEPEFVGLRRIAFWGPEREGTMARDF